MTTTTDLSVFDLSDLSHGHDGLIPSEVAAHPLFADKAEHFLTLQQRFEEDRIAIHALATEAPAAVAADRHALAVAMAADEDDPGTPATDALAKKLQAARRRITGLSDALNTAYRALVDALIDHCDEWEKSLDLAQTERRARAVDLIDELAANLRRAEAPAAALRWMALATDPRRTWGGLPYPHVAEQPVFVQGAQLQREHVLAGLRAAVQ
jgi:hypothetical protein